jgi:hypothetical protein
LVHAALGQRKFRFINDRDIVPRVPFFGMGFRHYGCEIFFNHEDQRVDCVAAVENLTSALRLALQGVNFDPIEEAAKLFREAVLKSAFHGNPLEAVEELMHARELATVGQDLDLVLKAGADNIADHGMADHYLVRLGTKLELAAAASATEPVTPPVH